MCIYFNEPIFLLNITLSNSDKCILVVPTYFFLKFTHVKYFSYFHF